MSEAAGPDALAVLRDQVAGLLSQIDTAAKPRPDHINPAGHAVPGPEWRPIDGYGVRVSTDPDSRPLDVVHVIWPDCQWSGDMDAMTSHKARLLAMALLAAADWADQLAAGVSQLDAARPNQRANTT